MVELLCHLKPSWGRTSKRFTAMQYWAFHPQRHLFNVVRQSDTQVTQSYTKQSSLSHQSCGEKKTPNLKHQNLRERKKRQIYNIKIYVRKKTPNLKHQNLRGKKDEKFTTSLTTSRTTLDVCHNTDRGRCPNQMKSDEKWKRGNVEKWKRGKVETWKRGNVETWKRGNVETWKRGNVETWKRENVETWKRGKVETWKRGNVETWKRENVETWKRGNVEKWYPQVLGI